MTPIFIKNEIAKWHKRTRTQQNQYLICFFVACFAISFLLVAVCKKQTNRMQQEIAAIQAQDVNVRLSAEIPAGVTVAELSTSLNVLRTATENVKKREVAIRQKMAPRGDLDAHQKLKVAISQLASNSDMLLDKMTDVGLSASEAETLASEQRWNKLAQNSIKRPLLHFEARASYQGLMQFLEGLNKLPYLVAPLHFDIQVKLQNDDDGMLRQWLSVTMVLSL